MSSDAGFPGYTVKDRRWWAHPEEERPADKSEETSGPPTRIAALEAELADRERLLREAQVGEREARLEVERARARLERDARKEIERSRRDLILALLPVLDDLDRAIAAAGGGASTNALLTGVEHVRSGFLDRLRTFGVDRFEATGERFDPARHEAVSTVVAGADQDGLVVQTLRPGYFAADETIRPAQVIVAVRDAPLRSWGGGG